MTLLETPKASIRSHPSVLKPANILDSETPLTLTNNLTITPLNVDMEEEEDPEVVPMEADLDLDLDPMEVEDLLTQVEDLMEVVEIAVVVVDSNPNA